MCNGRERDAGLLAGWLVWAGAEIEGNGLRGGCGMYGKLSMWRMGDERNRDTAR